MPFNVFGNSSSSHDNGTKIDPSLFVQKPYLRTNYIEANIEEDVDLKNHYKIKNLPDPTNKQDEIGNTLNKMTDNTGFLKTHNDPQRGWIIKNHPIKMLRGTKVENNENKYNITPGLRKVLVDQSYDTPKTMTDKDKLIFRDILRKTV